MPENHPTESSLRAVNRTEVLQGQLPYLLSIIVAAASIALAGIHPDLASSAMVNAVAPALAVTLLALAVPWERIRPGWIIAVPLLDVVVVAVFNSAARTFMPGIAFVIAFPVLWMVFRFAGRALPVAFACGMLVSAMPFIRAGTAPATPADWAQILGFPVVVFLFAYSTFIVGERFRQLRAQAERSACIARDALAAAEDREVTIKAVVDTVDAGIALFDLHGGVTLSNAKIRAQAELAGTTLTNAPDAPYIFEMDGSTRAVFADIVANTAGDGSAAAENTFIFGQQGRQRAIRVRSDNVLRPSGDIHGSVVITHDVTDLVDAVKLRDDFLTSVSHELRTPLTSIIGYLEIIEDSVDAHGLGFDRHLTTVQKNADRLLVLISDLLASAEQRASMLRRPMDLGELVLHAMASIHPTATAGGVSLVGGPFPPLVAEIDRGRIGQVVDNLLSNAVKYSPAGGDVTVTLSHDAEADTATIRVTDSGMGMIEEDQRRVFERFFRSDSVKRNAIAGVGVGLAIAKSYVELHNGSITVQSVLGTGTSMTITLPLHVRTGTATPPTRSTPAEAEHTLA